MVVVVSLLLRLKVSDDVVWTDAVSVTYVPAAVPGSDFTTIVN